MPSFFWKYFTRKGNNQASCNSCNRFLTIKSTTTLAYHLKSSHNIVDPEKTSKVVQSKGSDPSDVESPPPKRQKTILECYQHKSLKETVSRLAAVDGLVSRA